LDPRSRQGIRYLQNPHLLHAAIYEAMPTQPVVVLPGESRPLWRLDIGDPRRPILYVASPEKPAWDKLANQAGQIVDGRVYDARDYAPFLERLQPGDIYAFRLAANPVHQGRVKEGTATKRFGHVTPDQQVMWLLERAGSHGFEVLPSATGAQDVATVGRRRLSFRRAQKTITLDVVDLAGHLRIADSDLLRQTLVSGIGHGRAYGCGLMTLATPRLA
jgi:CRISPR system Cascade subunit CasE